MNLFPRLRLTLAPQTFLATGLAVLGCLALCSASRAGNSPPTDLVLSSSAFPENQSPPLVVATLSAVDADAGDSHVFTLVPGTGDLHNELFEVFGAELRTAAWFDAEDTQSLQIRLRATDGGWRLRGAAGDPCCPIRQ
jgi:hypothetical protein